MIRDLFSEKMKNLLHDDEWLILQEQYRADECLKYESLFCLTNGYMGTRGSYEEGTKKSLPCTFVNGVFDKSETFMRELANLPNWLGLKLYVEKEEIGIEDCELLEFARVLDMKGGFLAKRMVLRDGKKRETLIEGIRLVSRAHTHRMALQIFVTPLNYSGIVEVENIVDGAAINFCDAPRFKVKHTYLVKNEKLQEDGAYVEVATRDNHLHVGVGSHVEAYKDGKSVIKNRQFGAFGETAVEFLDFDAEKGETIEVVKFASIYTQREHPAFELHTKVRDEIACFVETGISKELEAHQAIYEKLWAEADIKIEGDAELNRAIRFNIFHLMSTANEHNDRVNIGAKLLHGEEYGGHAFWDTEIFMLPFFAHTFPNTASNLVSYRHHLLDAARANAKKNGYAGAQYPWESADDGTEQCPDYTIEPDGSCYRCYVAVYEHHVTAAVAYGIYNYCKITKDTAFLLGKGAEILFETARFWASRCQYNEAENRYEILKVTGPDEWHEPVDNNVYTNYLARWNLRYVLGLVDEFKTSHKVRYEELVERLQLTEAEYQDWQTKQEKMYLPHQSEGSILEQFEGYFKLEEAIITEYDANDWPVKPEILKRVNKSQTQVLKQADIVMLMHLMGHEFDEETIRDNYEYYEKRTLHGSSLSPSIYAIMGLRVGDGSKAYRYLKRAAFIDLLDLQKNTREGIHAANAGGVWQTVIYGFAGMSIDNEGELGFHPNLPEQWKSLTFRTHYRGEWLEVNIKEQNQVSVKVL